MKKFDVYFVSETGKRERNEDSYLILNPRDDILFLAVSDGMGGHQCGDIASKLVIESCQKTLYSFLDKRVEPFNIKSILIKIFYNAQEEIRNHLKLYSNIKFMGATLTCLLIVDNYYGWGNIGDSRLYKITNKEVKLLTVDHTLVNAIDSGINSAVVRENMTKILTRAIDGSFDEPDIFPDVELYSEINDNESFLLCSDGLIIDRSTENNEFIYNFLKSKISPQEWLNSLVKNAIKNGSDDNITVIYALNNCRKRSKIFKKIISFIKK